MDSNDKNKTTAQHLQTITNLERLEGIQSSTKEQNLCSSLAYREVGTRGLKRDNNHALDY